MSEFYIYRHVRNDLNIPFYIGMAEKRDGFKDSCTEYQRAYFTFPGKRSKHWTNIYNKTNKDISIDILYESDSFEEIKQKEIEFIKMYGRMDLGMGPLVNFTNGGEGVWGIKKSKESIKKQIDSRVRNNKPISDDTRRKISEKSKATVRTKEWNENISKGHKGKKISPEHFVKLQEGRRKFKGPKNYPKGRAVSQETRIKIALAHAKRNAQKPPKIKLPKKSRFSLKHSEEVKLKMSLAKKGRPSPRKGAKLTDAQKNHLSAINIGKKLSEDTKRKISFSLLNRKTTG